MKKNVSTFDVHSLYTFPCQPDAGPVQDLQANDLGLRSKGSRLCRLFLCGLFRWRNLWFNSSSFSADLVHFGFLSLLLGLGLLVRLHVDHQLGLGDVSSLEIHQRLAYFFLNM